MYFLHARKRRKEYSSENNNGANSIYYFNEMPMENFPLSTCSVPVINGENVATRGSSRLSKK